MPIASCALTRLWPRTVTIAIARSRLGNASMTSIRRMSTLSVRPKNPAIAPRNIPMAIEKPTVTNPIHSETRAP